MAVQKNVLEKSRLGRLLVNRGYISDSQLEEALNQQRESDVKLGEVLINNGWISEKELNRTLKHQSRYRYAAAFIAMAVTPFQPVVALAASGTAQASIPTTNSQYQLKSGLQPLDDAEMGAVSAQGLSEDFSQLYTALSDAQADPEKLTTLEESGELEGVEVLGKLGKVFFPLANVLDADVEIEGVTIDPSRVKPLLTGDGGFNVTLPNRIERVSFRNIRPMGQPWGPSMGSVHIEGIEFSDEASIVIRPLH